MKKLILTWLGFVLLIGLICAPLFASRHPENTAKKSTIVSMSQGHSSGEMNCCAIQKSEVASLPIEKNQTAKKHVSQRVAMVSMAPRHFAPYQKTIQTFALVPSDFDRIGAKSMVRLE
ncbi:hypothetical protein IPJ72_06810 [Candidatus Peregrinibacteria bacterium]|nr:MAG: hypothetical protein IPJ72_06810 [Candidatus Peregrinibacteria bacterium]